MDVKKKVWIQAALLLRIPANSRATKIIPIAHLSVDFDRDAQRLSVRKIW
jgi:hypothetical protein